MILQSWKCELQDFPDRAFADYILRGIERGFRIGFDAKRTSLSSHRGNLLSAREKPDVVQHYLDHELATGRVAKVTPDVAQSLLIHCSPFGVIPKKNKPGKWRLIVDLSSPSGHSVNDGITKELATLNYVSIDEIVDQVLLWGRGSLLAKMDIKHAFRNVPVHPDDRILLGMSWEGNIFIDTVLPFGLRSAPLIFTAVADALEWIMRRKGVQWVTHYIDDYITVGWPGSEECTNNISIMHRAFEEVGLPVEPEKDEGPDTCITCLGLDLDTVALEVRLPPAKLRHLRSLLASWRGRKACRKRELLSLLGILTHASKAVKAGRSFTRRLIDLAKSAHNLDQYLRLSREARADIEWWHLYVLLKASSARNNCHF